MDRFAKEIAGALKATIKAHRPITESEIASATKRLRHALRESNNRERDALLHTTPRRQRGQGNKFLAAR